MPETHCREVKWMGFENQAEQGLNPASATDSFVSLHELLTHFSFFLCKMETIYFTGL